MRKTKRWSVKEKLEISTLLPSDSKAINKHAKITGRTYYAVYAAVKRYGRKYPTIEQPIVKQLTTKQNVKNTTIVFNNYKTVIVETNSILIEF